MYYSNAISLSIIALLCILLIFADENTTLLPNNDTVPYRLIVVPCKPGYSYINGGCVENY